MDKLLVAREKSQPSEVSLEEIADELLPQFGILLQNAHPPDPTP